MENQNTQQIKVRELLIEWSCNFTDKFINEKILPIAEELLNDKAFVTLLEMWGNEKGAYERFRNRDVALAFEKKLDFSKLCKDVKVSSYQNDVFVYSNTLQSIVSHWGDAK